MPKQYDEQTRAKAVRLVQEHREDYASEYEAIKAIAGRLGMNPETLRMVDELLDMSRIISGRIELHCVELDIGDAVERGIERSAPLVAKRAHRLHVDTRDR